MKKTILLSLLSVALVSCGNSETYTIHGTTDPAFDGTTLYLKAGEVTDSTILRNGTFTFTGKTAAPATADIFGIAPDRKYLSAQCILEPGTIVIKLDPAGGTLPEGTPLNEKFKDYYGTVHSMYVPYRARLDSLVRDTLMDEAVRDSKVRELQERYSADITAVYLNYFEQNKDNIVGAFPMFSVSRDDNRLFDSLYNIACEDIRRTDFIQVLKKAYDATERTKEGAMFQDFTVENGTADGQSVSLSDYVGKGKYVLVDFWASWCVPCIQETPHLLSVYKKYKGDRFEILGIAVNDEQAKTENAIEKHGILWPVIFNAGRNELDLYGINGIPHIILFGPDGTVLARDLRGERIAEKVSEYLDAR